MKMLNCLGILCCGLAACAAENAALNWEKLAPEVEYAVIQEEKPRPQLFHALRIARRHRELKVVSALGNRRIFGLETLPGMLKSRNLPTAGTPVAAVNGDFFTIREDTNYTGTLRGLQISEGELVSAPEGAAAYPWTGRSMTFFAVDLQDLGFAEVRPQLRATLADGRSFAIGVNGMIRPGGAMLFTPRLALAPGEKPHAVYSMSSRTVDHPELVLRPLDSPLSGEPYIRVGATRELSVEAVRPQGNSPIRQDRYILALPSGTALPEIGTRVMLTLATEPDLSRVRTAISGHARLVKDGIVLAVGGRKTRAPRTVIGYDADYLYLIVADGRMATRAAGLDFDELAVLAARFGAREAVDFDGGGSSMIWAAGALRNQLYTLPEVRRFGNALIILRP